MDGCTEVLGNEAIDKKNTRGEEEERFSVKKFHHTHTQDIMLLKQI